ncbi:diacylglycerol kinase family lipid kinase [bacterium]|nr:diacylglycerol kinase family lipid kinase [bacterium]MBU3955573.1 diacylglycerol kinase family lipid kinase [bacterium]
MIKLICNPQANKGRGARLIPLIAKELGINIKDVCITSGYGHAEEEARHAVRDNYSGVVCAGGDGILNAVINGVLTSDKNVKVGFIPMGMSNVAALSAGIPMDIREACTVVKLGYSEKLDIGRIKSDGQAARYFFTMADCGLTAQAVLGGESNQKVKKIWGRLAILGNGFYYGLKDKSILLNISFDGRKEKAYLLIAANGSYYGGKYRIAPADMQDGKLDLCLFKSGGKADIWRYFTGFLRGKLADYDDVRYFKVSRVDVCSSLPVSSQIDGEPYHYTPCRIEAIPAKLSMFLPRRLDLAEAAG